MKAVKRRSDKDEKTRKAQLEERTAPRKISMFVNWMTETILLL